MKHKVFLEWGGDGPESWNPGQTVTVEVDDGDLFDGIEEDESYRAAFEKALRKFAEDLSEEFDADSFQTEKMIEEQNKAEQAHLGKMLDGAESPEEAAAEIERHAG